MKKEKQKMGKVEMSIMEFKFKFPFHYTVRIFNVSGYLPELIIIKGIFPIFLVLF